MKKIAIIGNYGAGNIGDELILRGLLEIVGKKFPGAKITVMSANPEQTSLEHKVASCHKFPAGLKSFFAFFKTRKYTIPVLKEADFVIFGGGGLFGGPEDRANYIWALQALWVMLYRKKLIIFGQSLGPPKNSKIKYLVKKIFAYASKIYVRDKFSANLIRELLPMTRVTVLPDCAFATKIPTKPSSYKAYKEILIVLRDYHGLNLSFLSNLAEFLNYLTIEKKCHLSLLPFQENSQSNDNKLHKKLLQSLLNKDNVTIYSVPKTQEELLERYNHADLVIGMRLHSIITAIKTRRPFIALSYDQKVTSLLKDFKLQDLGVEITKFNNSRQLKQKYTVIQQNNLAIKQYLRECEATSREKLLKLDFKDL